MGRLLLRIQPSSRTGHVSRYILNRGERMVDSRKIIRVFLASPGDLSDERASAKIVVDEFNAIYGEAFRCHVDLIGWEDTVSRYGRPQKIINQDVERCEYFIGMMWKHWGSPPDRDGKYTSGFEEEFELALRTRAKSGKPEISLLFKHVDQSLALDPGESLKRVIGFREKIVAEKQLYFEGFNNLRDFETKMRRCISSYVLNLLNLESTKIAEETKNAAEPDEVASTQQAILPMEGMAFLRNLIDGDRGTNEDGSASPLEVARFRLLGEILGKSGNDDKSLGVHDANILFAGKLDVEFSQMELDGLVSCGLRNVHYENVPLWHWLKLVTQYRANELAISTLVGPPEARRGALTAMRLI